MQLTIYERVKSSDHAEEKKQRRISAALQQATAAFNYSRNTPNKANNPIIAARRKVAGELANRSLKRIYGRLADSSRQSAAAQHNKRRFSLYASFLHSRIRRQPTAQEIQAHKDKVALKYGHKYHTLTLQRSAELTPANDEYGDILRSAAKAAKKKMQLPKAGGV